GWLEKDAAGAAAYVLNHLEEPRALLSVRTTAFGLFFVDKDVAVSWVQKLPTEEIRREAETEIVKYWSGSDPTAAANWSAHLPAEERDAALGTVVTSWSLQDADAALTWINGLSGGVRDEALETLAFPKVQASPRRRRSKWLIQLPIATAGRRH
ncbi:MAG TPA: hypothetical protein VGQ82_04965, partial [Chthoniobacterales bacterium]|nr:hypothetical protein [Chthoniobacterales bacterium]